MSIIYCEKHDLRWDSDMQEECPRCEDSMCGGQDHICLVAEARGEQNRCQGKCAYEDSPKPQPSPQEDK